MKYFFILFLLIILLTPFYPAQAIQILPGCATAGNGGICCALLTISNLARWILGIVGASALLFFVYGGFLWITSAGVSSRVQQGQKIMTGTVVGILIVVLAWTAVNFIITSFVNTDEAQTKFKFTGPDDNWYSMCEGWDACKSLGSKWSCQILPACGLTNYTQCEKADNCERFLCPEGNNNVCCNPEIPTGLKDN